MTIKEYIDSAKKLNFRPQTPGGESFLEISLQNTEVWSNAASNGYAIEAAKKVGLSEEQISKFLTELARAYDDITVDEAEKIYEDSGY